MFFRVVALMIILCAGATTVSAGRVIQVDCRMDSCVWADIVSTRFVKGGNDIDTGYLMEVDLRYGMSEHRGGDYPDRYRPTVDVDWQHPSRRQLAFCSKARPALFEDGDDRITVLGVTDPFGYEYGAVVLYTFVCHGIEHAATGQEMKELGYPANDRTEFATLEALMQPQVVRTTQKSIRTSCWLFEPDVAVINVQNFVNIRRKVGFNAPVIYEARIGERLTAQTHYVHYFGTDQQGRRCSDVCEYLKSQPGYQARGYEAQVLNQCFEENVMWYEVTTPNGRTGFVSGRYLASVSTTIAAAAVSVPVGLRGAWLARDSGHTCVTARNMGEYMFTLVGENSVTGHESFCELSNLSVGPEGFSANTYCSGEGETWTGEYTFLKQNYIYCGPK